ncbi:hypothetical protein J2W48_000043 [Flavobacterium piscis]|uniref:Uncharacterized protein n=1 Tax=Flavobacterium piscis TaxID=1114874 RepID=A0ABU1Y1M8_9FLAO|nr:hypothetical protein [Flavobacterium piscis]
MVYAKEIVLDLKTKKSLNLYKILTVFISLYLYLKN